MYFLTLNEKIAKQGELPPSVSYPNDPNLDPKNWPNGLNNFDQVGKICNDLLD